MVYRRLFERVLARMDPETAHERGIALLRAGRIARPLVRATHAPRTVMGIEFPNAFGLAAGFDKNAVAVPGLLALGFGHVEVGTVTARAQPGNPPPRLFRLIDDRAIINRMGFNNEGAAAVAARLERLRSSAAGRDAVIGVNIGKSKATPAGGAVADYRRSAALLAPHASYIVVNVSSPNTPGLRDLQVVHELAPILDAVKKIADRTDNPHSVGRVPLVVKIAPDLDAADIDAIAELALELGIDGISATNTTVARPAALKSDPEIVSSAGAGGLSGPILRARAAEVLVSLRERVGERLALIGVGGVFTPRDVTSRLAAGADLVQGYTGFIYQGPSWPARMARATRA